MVEGWIRTQSTDEMKKTETSDVREVNLGQSQSIRIVQIST
jgi:hypothetical protein